MLYVETSSKLLSLTDSKMSLSRNDITLAWLTPPLPHHSVMWCYVVTFIKFCHFLADSQTKPNPPTPPLFITSWLAPFPLRK